MKPAEKSCKNLATVLEVLGQLNASAVVSNLNEKQQELVNSHLQLANSNVAELEKKTLLQSLSAARYEERKKRLMASNFG